MKDDFCGVMRQCFRLRRLKQGLCFVLACVMMFGVFSSTALAAWNGDGQHDMSNVRPLDPNNGFALHGTPLHGFRFTVFDENWNKLGHSIDIHFQKETVNTYRTYKGRAL